MEESHVQINSTPFKIVWGTPDHYDIEPVTLEYLDWKCHKSPDSVSWQTNDKTTNLRPDTFIMAWDFANSAREAKVLHIKEGSPPSMMAHFHIIWCYTKDEADRAQIIDQHNMSFDPLLSHLGTRMDIIPAARIIEVLPSFQVPKIVCQLYVIDWDRKKYVDVESTDRALDWITSDSVAARFGS